MAIVDIIEVVNARLSSYATTKVGKEFVSILSAPPRVVWEPMTDRYVGSRQHGSVAAGTATTIARSKKTRQHLVNVHIWAAGAQDSVDPHKHLRALDVLVDRVVMAIHRSAVGSYSIEGGEHQEAEVNTHGRGYILSVAFECPVLDHPDDEATAAVTIINTTQTGTIENPGSP